MVTFLDHNQYWKGAILFHHADTLPYWRKRKNLPHQPAAVDVASLQELAGLIRSYFHDTEGRGNNCVVEPFRRGELDYFFAYPEDYSQQSIEWVDGQFGRRPHNPAFEVIYVCKAIRSLIGEATEQNKIDLADIPAGKFRTIIIDPPWPLQMLNRDVRPSQVTSTTTKSNLYRQYRESSDRCAFQ